MLVTMVFAGLALALWFPETRIGSALRRLLIDEPARRLDRVKRGHVLLALVVSAALAAAYAAGREAGVLVAGQVAADGLAYAMAIDVATWLDVTAIALIVAAAVYLREAIRLVVGPAWRLARRCAGSITAPLVSLARGRSRRTRPATPSRHGEDPDRPALTFALA